jgi:hypothetical protein
VTAHGLREPAKGKSIFNAFCRWLNPFGKLENWATAFTLVDGFVA